MRNQSSKRVNNFPKVTQLVGGGDRVPTYEPALSLPS